MATVAKKAAKPAAKPVAKAKAAPKAAKSDGWVCQECGFEFTIDDWGDAEVTQFLCCEKPMKARRVPVKAKVAAKPAAKAKAKAKAK